MTEPAAPSPATAPPPVIPVRDRTAEQRAKNTAHPERGPLFPSRVPWLAVAVFVVIAFGGAWAAASPLWLSGDGLNSPWFPLCTLLMMFSPALAALVVVFLVKRPPSIPRLLGLSPLRPWKRTWGWMLISGVAFSLLPFAALLVGALFGWVHLDFTTFGGFAELLRAQGTDLGRVPVQLIVAIQLLVLPLVVIQASVAAFGEELGWRGWLLPNLRPLGTWPALVITGVIWGLWHSPLILLGYNYQTTDAWGVLAMTLWCVLLGILVGYTRLRTASVWPAALAHGALNAATNTYLVFLAAGQLPQEALAGTILGWSGAIVMAVVIVVLALTGQLRKQPLPGLTLAESAER